MQEGAEQAMKMLVADIELEHAAEEKQQTGGDHGRAEDHHGADATGWSASG